MFVCSSSCLWDVAHKGYVTMIAGKHFPSKHTVLHMYYFYSDVEA